MGNKRRSHEFETLWASSLPLASDPELSRESYRIASKIMSKHKLLPHLIVEDFPKTQNREGTPVRDFVTGVAIALAAYVGYKTLKR
ncbi:MAG: hypothetical protein HYT62_02915 [Candidatus Yanofskybacteria bacterium]|nr:hypothetical protein [Candidatus Yanofskybacteria bacterium]